MSSLFTATRNMNSESVLFCKEFFRESLAACPCFLNDDELEMIYQPSK